MNSSETVLKELIREESKRIGIDADNARIERVYSYLVNLLFADMRDFQEDDEVD